MESFDQKIVEFQLYCPTCKYAAYPEQLEPCYECIGNPTNTNTNQPVLFKEA